MPKKNPIDEFVEELKGQNTSTSKLELKPPRPPKEKNHSTANLGFEARLWEAANALRGSMDAAEYKHVVLGLIFLKYISDAFEEHRQRLEQEPYADPEDPDEYRAANVFWVPSPARWERLKQNARRPEIGRIVDEAMEALERENPSLKGVLPKDYARPALDKQRLGQLIDLITNIRLEGKEARSKDVLGRVYEYFLGQFASAEGRKGGEFYTPASVVKLLVEMLEPFEGRVYDPCCGSGGMFVQSVRFVEAHATGNGNGGRARARISIYGQELNYTTWRLCKMNLAIRGIEGKIEQGDTFLNDRFPDLKADYILANPPFNMKNWGAEQLRHDKRWKYGLPPARNANFAWLQHMIHHLSPVGYAGVVLANGSLSSNQSNEGEIRKNIVEADLVDCIVALPDKLFYTTQIPACLWFLARDKSGFCKSVSLEEIRKHDYVLTPGRYVGVPQQEEDDEPFEEKMVRLVAELETQFTEGAKLEEAIRRNLRELGFYGN
ncbi:class I SAM-dependent DNA methyltransferase [Thermosulfurimonas sp.]|uniref:type I restriction-modification system subunit M n=1 Tax=Thermosulfurimonas sp. TaxID=2080236 RepID=UPI00341B4322